MNMHMWLPLNSEAGKSATTKALHLVVLLLSSWLVVTLSIDTFRQVPFAERDCFTRMQLWVCLFFIFDFVVQWALAPNRWRYLSRHFIFLLVSIPYVELFSWFQVACSAELSYFLRLVPFVRSGYALAIVVDWVAHNRVSTLFFTYLVLLLATVYFSSLLFLEWERPANPLVAHYADALWWAFMDVTTVGSNIYATTAVGKILSVVLAALGMMMFPIFTVYITDWVRNASRRKNHGMDR